MKKRITLILLFAFILLIAVIVLVVHLSSRENGSLPINGSISSSQSESYRDKEVVSIEYFESKTDKLEKEAEALEKELEGVIEQYNSANP